MAKQVTIGGNRLGAGKKMQTGLNHYNRSNHNLTKGFISSMAPGMLVPCYVRPALNGDKFKFNINAAVRTLPTEAPLFGSFKLQIDYFLCPIRLYQGILHNNPVNLGLKMNQVKLPKLRFTTITNDHNNSLLRFIDKDFRQVSPNALVRYCGLAGIGNTRNASTGTTTRLVSATPMIAYYDIFKNYYANKQEENAFVIAARNEIDAEDEIEVNSNGFEQAVVPDSDAWMSWRMSYSYNSTKTQCTLTYNPGQMADIDTHYNLVYSMYLNVKTKTGKIDKTKLTFECANYEGTFAELEAAGVLQDLGNGVFLITGNYEQGKYIFSVTNDDTQAWIALDNSEYIDNTKIHLRSFPLKNIDDMRKEILTMQELGEEFVIGDRQTDKGQYLPYSTLYETNGKYITKNIYACNGIVLKTYQSDLFNNWLNSETISGENGINEISAVDVSNGKLTMDALNLSQKIYEMLNRVAISGGTYDDWQEAVYDVNAVRKAETPMYCGGMSAEIVFDEVISTAESTNDGKTQKLGTLAGKGEMVGRKGGNITIKVTEPSYIIGIASITPRLCYSQGNEWYMTELDSIDDFHKPALDAIGFQDLITEQMHWREAQYDATEQKWIRRAAGKVPAWINYMTDVSKAYGDFADPEKAGYMVLDRNYNTERSDEDATYNITDLTTYIDPTKYNYAFAYKELDAQNFWVQIVNQITAREVMSAKIIPNI